MSIESYGGLYTPVCDIDGNSLKGGWHPSIHMPKEAARIFLKITGVRVERLQDITAEQCVEDGITIMSLKEVGAEFTIGQFSDLWDSTIPNHPNKFKSYPYYWKDNPWVWVYNFEKLEVSE